MSQEQVLNQTGLEWKEVLFGIEPCWTMEPNIADIELITREHLKIQDDAPCHVTSYAQGAFNKLYKIQSRSDSYLMRVTLPVDPHNKTNSEVATISFVRQNTDIPVPRIFAHDDMRVSRIGFEWILMELLPGKSLNSRWRKMSEEDKVMVVKQIAGVQAQLFHHRLSGIGNLFDKAADTNLEGSSGDSQDLSQGPQPVLGQIVSMNFFMGDHIFLDVPRGPFTGMLHPF